MLLTIWLPEDDVVAVTRADDVDVPLLVVVADDDTVLEDGVLVFVVTATAGEGVVDDDGVEVSSNFDFGSTVVVVPADVVAGSVVAIVAVGFSFVAVVVVANGVLFYNEKEIQKKKILVKRRAEKKGIMFLMKYAWK